MNSIKEKDPPIYLFTTEFPFGKGEQFLETEIRLLATFSNKITVVPKKTEGNQRSLPSNVTLDLSFSASFLKDNVKEILHPKNVKFILRHEEIRNTLNPLNWKRALRAAYNAQKAYLWASEKFCHQEDNIVFYSYWLEFYTFGLALFSKKKNNFKLISRAHGYDLYNYRHPFNFIPFRKKLLETITKTYSVSLDGSEYLKKKYPHLAEKFLVSKLGTLDYGNKASLEPVMDQLNIVSCSLLYPLKRVDLILKSLFKLAEENPDLKLNWTHIGDGPLLDEIKTLAISNTQKNLKVNLLGHLSNSEVLDFYNGQTIQVFINVSSTGGVPVSIMEAQSIGIPVIATSVGGTPEIVDNNNGILLPASPTIDEIKEAVKKFTNIHFQQQKRINSRKSWEKKYNAEKNYTKFYKEISQLH